MSLTRQAALLLVGALWLAVLGSLGVHALGMQKTLQLQLEVRNNDDASLLALALSQQGGDEALMRTVAAATFDLGHYSRLTLRGEDGRVWFDLRGRERPAQTPRWLTRAMPIEAAAGTAQVSDGWRPLGRLEVAAHSAWAYESLWSALQRTAALLAVLGAATALAGVLALRAWQRPLNVTVAQAKALEDGRFVIADEPRAPELRRLTRSMNSMVRRLQQWFDTQAAQVDALQQVAQNDAVTGLPNRRRFMGLIESDRDTHSRSVGALLLVRVQDLQGLNERFGHQAADDVLRAIADVLQNYQNQVHGAFTGRLNGSDFALALPVAGMAEETAAALMQALRASPVGRVSDGRLVIGGVDHADALTLPALLATADAALAKAEAEGPFAVALLGSAADATVQGGAHAWRVGIEQALQAGHAQLDAQAVRDRTGRLLHLSCPLSLQLDPGDGQVPSRQWLPLAARSRLLPRVDLASIRLALEAIEADGTARSVQVSAMSMAESGFIDEVHGTLLRHPAAAQQLLLEVAEPTSEPLVHELREAVAVWRATGVKVGIEEAGGTLQGRAWLQTIALQQVRIAGRTLAGVAGDPTLQQYARSLATLVHGLGCKILAADVDDAADLAAIWELGFDGASGAAVAAAD